MEHKKIVAEKVLFKKLFSEDFWFVIPEYQRSYVWQSDNINELMDDLKYAFKNQPNGEYFLGSIVLRKTNEEKFNEYEVLDGQQRLTTFLLMMSVLRDKSDNIKVKNSTQKAIYQEEDDIQDIPERVRLTYKIRENTEEFFDNIVIADQGTKDDNSLDKYMHTDNKSVSNMAKAIKTMEQNLNEAEDIKGFTRFVLNNALFIYVATDNMQDAFRLFTILNNRGIPLTAADILKSENISNIKLDRNKEKYARIWEGIEDDRCEGFDRFLQFIRTIIVKEKARLSILDEFEKKIYAVNKLKKGEETICLLKNYNDIYNKVIELENTEFSCTLKNLITVMKLGFHSEDWIPPVLTYYNKFGDDGFYDFVVKLDYKFAGDWISGYTPTVRQDAMNAIIKIIERSDKSMDVLSNKSIFEVDKEILKRYLDQELYRKRYTRYVLLKLEYLMGDNTAYIAGYNYLSIEHVLPQVVKNDSQWNKDFTDTEHKYWKDRLANLVLINSRKNAKLSNCDFIEKREKYLEKQMDVFHANKILLEKEMKWTPTILSNRQRDLINLWIANEVEN